MEHILIVGLGNPGLGYEDTRHNIGFRAIDKIAQYFDFPNFSAKFSAHISSKVIGQNKITLMKPQTYMNLSGQAVAKLVSFYKVPLEDLIVIHDDLDLGFAKIKMKIAGGAGGHNGIKSIDQHLGSNYYRVRIGIGKPDASYETSNFVLGKFTQGEEKVVEVLLKNLIDNIELVLAKDMPSFMNKMSLEYKKYGI
jgi:PTH1 family peptidyl-tRNA hydrolase